MSKWLARLREHEKNRQMLDDGTDKTPRTPKQPILGVLSVTPRPEYENFSPCHGDDEHVVFEEQAAILEYDCGLSRSEAERLARLQISGTRH